MSPLRGGQSWASLQLCCRHVLPPGIPHAALDSKCHSALGAPLGLALHLAPDQSHSPPHAGLRPLPPRTDWEQVLVLAFTGFGMLDQSLFGALFPIKEG